MGHDPLDTYVRGFLDKLSASERRRVQLYLPIGLWGALNNIARTELTTLGDIISDDLRRIARVLRQVPADRRDALARWAQRETARWARDDGERLRDRGKIWIALPPWAWEIFVAYARLWNQSLDHTLSRFFSGSVMTDRARLNVLKAEESYWEREEDAPKELSEVIDLSDVDGDTGFSEEE